MSNCISYSLFGYNHENKDSFDFKSYLRYFSFNLRMAKLIYPGWSIHLISDDETYNSPYKHFFDYHAAGNLIDLTVVKRKELCLMMLHRLYPVFLTNARGFSKYERVICRDLDSLLTYRERQAVQFWIDEPGMIAHGITDSISHNIPLMGGMCGYASASLKEKLAVDNFEDMVSLLHGIDYSIKGADQIFLNAIIFPRVVDAFVGHFLLGMPHGYVANQYRYVQDVDLDISPELKESNVLINHIGQAGFIIEPVMKFFRKHMPDESYFFEIEKKYPDVFYWYA